MMFGFGWIMMLLVIGLPILLVVLLVGGAAGLLQNQAHMSAPRNQSPPYYATANPNQAAITPARYCSHCGAGMQSDWTHCPQCGAPIQ